MEKCPICKTEGTVNALSYQKGKFTFRELRCLRCCYVLSISKERSDRKPLLPSLQQQKAPSGQTQLELFCTTDFIGFI